jgi:hypothetical protein
MTAYKHVSLNRASYGHGEKVPCDDQKHVKDMQVDRNVFNTFLPVAIMDTSTHLESFTLAAFPEYLTPFKQPTNLSI